MYLQDIISGEHAPMHGVVWHHGEDVAVNVDSDIPELVEVVTTNLQASMPTLARSSFSSSVHRLRLLMCAAAENFMGIASPHRERPTRGFRSRPAAMPAVGAHSAGGLRLKRSAGAVASLVWSNGAVVVALDLNEILGGSSSTTVPGKVRSTAPMKALR